ncbi:MAG: glycosyltransferase family 4 protein [Thermoleophilaceae bacterium]|nr:glycosyltransferase family 4 protein [Thermoleophilaceae bacterium]
MPRVCMALMFFPRGGSAQVARYMARALPRAGWDVTLVSGSLGPAGEESNAHTFFADAPQLHAVDYTAALEAPDPLLADPPFHPSFEDRPGAPDRIFAGIDEATYEHLVGTWEREFAEAGAGEADVIHLHHLTPMNEAAERSCPAIPRIGHLHGTELLMLREIDEGLHPGWPFAEQWAERMRGWARACERLFVLSPDAVRRVPALLGVDPERVVWAPNGFDPEVFEHRPLSRVDRHAFWRSWLVEDPRGWDTSGVPGSVSYEVADLEAFREGSVLLYVGRFTDVKRVPLLIRAYARARERFNRPAPLVLLGGYPGEWEGPHPLEVIAATGAQDVFLPGWRGHDDLAEGLNASDVLVLPSVREQFGQVLVEAMACGLPVIAADAHGPAEIVEDGETGWLVAPDHEDEMVEALVDAVNDWAKRERKGRAAYAESRASYSWPALAEDVAAVYDSVISPRSSVVRSAS